MILILQFIAKFSYCVFIAVTTNGAGVFAVISTLAFVVFFAFGPGSIPWLITGELFTQGRLL